MLFCFVAGAKMEVNAPHIFPFLSSWIQNLCSMACLVIYSPDDKKALNCSTNYTAALCFAGKTGNQAFVRARWHQKGTLFYLS